VDSKLPDEKRRAAVGATGAIVIIAMYFAAMRPH
jgi:hypothetical protein